MSNQKYSRRSFLKSTLGLGLSDFLCGTVQGKLPENKELPMQNHLVLTQPGYEARTLQEDAKTDGEVLVLGSDYRMIPQNHLHGKERYLALNKKEDIVVYEDNSLRTFDFYTGKLIDLVQEVYPREDNGICSAKDIAINPLDGVLYLIEGTRNQVDVLKNGVPGFWAGLDLSGGKICFDNNQNLYNVANHSFYLTSFQNEFEKIKDGKSVKEMNKDLELLRGLRNHFETRCFEYDEDNQQLIIGGTLFTRPVHTEMVFRVEPNFGEMQEVARLAHMPRPNGYLIRGLAVDKDRILLSVSQSLAFRDRNKKLIEIVNK